MKKNFALLGLVAAFFASPVFAEDAAKPTTEDRKAEAAHEHQHKKKCGHKAEKHGDHTDYEHTVDGKTHHHKAHTDHVDECDGPESEAAVKSAPNPAT